ncbi:MAG: phosphate transport system regulatory protein PhoU, partial [Anaerolineae bacterium]|nr:phosphate transport system regulatory protein PhoU [Anaerolineae bacterium]
MVREALERELQRLQDETLALGSMVGNAITESVEVLKRRDMEASRRLIAEDRQINQKRFAIEADAVALIATQQPMASDLRAIAAVLDISHELERIGDYAKGIAKVNLMIGEEPLVKPLVDVPRMAEAARSMLHRALQAFVERDVDMARAIPT